MTSKKRQPDQVFYDSKKTLSFLQSKGLRISDSTLRAWRARGEGPKWSRFVGSIYYNVNDLESWFESCQKEEQS